MRTGAMARGAVACAGLRYQRRSAMIVDYALASLVTAGLLVYLLYALLNPARF